MNEILWYFLTSLYFSFMLSIMGIMDVYAHSVHPKWVKYNLAKPEILDPDIPKWVYKWVHLYDLSTLPILFGGLLILGKLSPYSMMFTLIYATFAGFGASAFWDMTYSKLRTKDWFSADHMKLWLFIPQIKWGSVTVFPKIHIGFNSVSEVAIFSGFRIGCLFIPFVYLIISKILL